MIPQIDEEAMEQQQNGARTRLLGELPVTERRLSLNGAATAVLEGGEGSPVVLLHGPAAYGAAWLRVIPDLVMSWRVVAPDLPGHGASGTFADAVDLDRVTGWLDDLIECTCTTPPILVGHTLGGAIAARFASERSDRLAGLVLVDTLGLRPFQPDPAFGAAVQEFMSAPSEQTLDRLWSLCAFDVAALHRRLGRQWKAVTAYTLDRARTPGLLAVQNRFLEVFGMPAIPPAVLSRIATPTTLVWGRHDLATPLSVAEEASTRFGWPLRVIEGAADDPTIEQPDEFLSILRPLLATLFQQEVAR
jgi:pimeloyl-ACP methyl ester carboxylesterase